MFIFDIFAVPLGYGLWFIYSLVQNYFLAIFLFTLLVRALTFPLSLKSQKSQAERAKLAPRIERLQKKYAQDRQKLATKQQELYEKEGVSMTGGCLPMVIQMVILMGIISVIYSPLTHLSRIPADVVNAGVTACSLPEGADAAENPTKVDPKKFTGYYKELELMKAMDANEADIKTKINELTDEQRKGKSANEYYEQMQSIREDFTVFGLSLLEKPEFTQFGVLWLIPLLSGLTALFSSMVSMHYTRAMMAKDAPGQGCSNNMMMIGMPLFSLFITFTVPGGVGVYWICSNLIAVLQTVILNHMYNPAKIRAQAEIEYEERRKKKAEDKKRLAEARRKAEEDRIRQEKEEAAAAEKARLEAAASNKKPVQATKNPNKLKKKENTGLLKTDEETTGNMEQDKDSAADADEQVLEKTGTDNSEEPVAEDRETKGE